MAESQGQVILGLPATVIDDPSHETLRSVGSAFGRTRLRTLVTLRWMAIAGQVAAVLFVNFLLGFELPLVACLAAIGASAWLNVALMAVFPTQHLSSPAETAGQLAFDIVQLSVLIGLTGGLENPFLLMILAPVTVGASRLLPAYAVLLSFLALGCCVVMWFWGLDLPWHGEPLQLPPLYQAGQLAAVAVGLVFFAIYSWRTGRDEASLVSALDAVQAVLAREQQLSALGALAAATAHELGTPLATIHIAAKELGRTVKPGHPAREDVELIIEQSERCRMILKQISQRRHMTDAAMARATLPGLIDEAVEPHQGSGIHVQCSCSPLAGSSTAGSGAGPEKAPDVIRKPEIIHALGAFVENAVSFASKEVSVNARWSDEEVRIYITDDGAGFAPSVLAKLGEPYFSERRIEQRGGGMGLGFFIACTLLERTGARVTPYNRQLPAKGAVVRIVWPRAAIEAPEGWIEA
ncbi:MAG TPA: ActS/PrrB/RegB family redox-sensitive histidine kinase [Hyphomonadaceae bacterium]|nr:ActS/PrrB/RegB family redox-sensitive histidine kinase [Hyphomonadaceae bacterium]HPN06665.1 ActS/PrrB/RegB family redox-sensitive histidine kinase [Hyphomonadaceae bacterium]